MEVINLKQTTWLSVLKAYFKVQNKQMECALPPTNNNFNKNRTPPTMLGKPLVVSIIANNIIIASHSKTYFLCEFYWNKGQS